MRNVAIFIAGTLISGLAMFVGCSSSNSTGTTGSGGSTGSTSSHSSTSTSGTASTSTSTSGTASTSSSTSGTASTSSSSGSTSTSSSSSSSGNDIGGGGGPANFTCTVPSTFPSNGSCITFTAPADGGPEVDAGLDDAGNATISTCNPVTNAGCEGTDVCVPDLMAVNFFCVPAGSPANLPLCGKCPQPTNTTYPTCVGGAQCLSVDQGTLPCTKNSQCPAAAPQCDTQNGYCVDFFCAQLCCGDTDCGSGQTCDIMDLQWGTNSNLGFCIPN